MNHTIKDLIRQYKNKRSAIHKRLKEFRSVYKGSDKDVFAELCFCILTANANALHCDKAIRELKETGLLFSGKPCQIRPKLRGRVRFHNKKAEFIKLARDLFTRDGKICLKPKIGSGDVFEVREWLVENIKGYGYKEASHFLRNIGLGRDITILDRHILKNLKKYAVIKDIPQSVGSRKVYIDIENKMRAFSKRIKIPLEDLDLLFWSIQTGFIFK